MIYEPFEMGWLRDYPDFRDYGVNHDVSDARMKMYGQRSVKKNLEKLGIFKVERSSLAPGSICPSTVRR